MSQAAHRAGRVLTRVPLSRYQMLRFSLSTSCSCCTTDCSRSMKSKGPIGSPWTGLFFSGQIQIPDLFWLRNLIWLICQNLLSLWKTGSKYLAWFLMASKPDSWYFEISNKKKSGSIYLTQLFRGMWEEKLVLQRDCRKMGEMIYYTCILKTIRMWIFKKIIKLCWRKKIIPLLHENL